MARLGLLIAGLLAAVQACNRAPVTLSIVGTNDLHGGMLPRDGDGGLALLAGYLANLRAARQQDGGDVLLLDAGDMFQGTLESNLLEGAPVVAAYNALGYSAAAVGNHEFDFGPAGPAAIPRTAADDARGALKARAAEAKFPFLAANLLDTSTGRPVAWRNVEPSTIVKTAGIAVGIIGVVTKDALSTTTAANIEGLSVAPLSPAIAAEASRLRRQGANAIVVAAHAGGRCTVVGNPDDVSSCETHGEIFDVARELPAGLVDVIVAGHVHNEIAHRVNQIAIVEAFSGGRAFSRVDLAVEGRTRQVRVTRIFPPQDVSGPRAEYEGRPVVADPAIANILAPAVERVRALKATSLGVVLDTPIRRLRELESPLGHLFAEAFRESTPGADVAIINTGGGLRADFPAGPLTYGSLYEALPFDNRLVPLRLTGGTLRRVLATHLQNSTIVLSLSGITVHGTCRDGQLAITLTRAASGRRVDANEPLTVVVPDFLATGGDNIFTPVIPPGGFPIPDAAPQARDVVADWLRKRGGTLREEQFIDPQRPRWILPGAQPVTCGH